MNMYKQFRLIDHTNTEKINSLPMTALTSFAIDDALAISVGKHESDATLRLWSHPKTVVLGIPDTRLPFIKEGVQYLAQQGYHVIVRNSGGLAVALDTGVLNMSFILPNMKQLSIDVAYDMMYKFIQQMFQDYTTKIRAYEIVGSYCPGDYDLSVNGQKFAGISQRRVRDGVAVQVYIDVVGNSFERAKHIQKFYDIGLKDEKTSFTYPTIDPYVLNSLDDLLNKNITFEVAKELAIKTLSSTTEHISKQSLTDAELTTLDRRYDQMIKRNENISSWLNK